MSVTPSARTILPVGPARQDPAVEARPLDASAENVDDAALAVGRAAEVLDVAEFGVDTENGLRAQHGGAYLTLPRRLRK
jgi:hypothetical protein